MLQDPGTVGREPANYMSRRLAASTLDANPLHSSLHSLRHGEVLLSDAS